MDPLVEAGFEPEHVALIVNTLRDQRPGTTVLAGGRFELSSEQKDVLWRYLDEWRRYNEGVPTGEALIIGGRDVTYFRRKATQYGGYQLQQPLGGDDQ